MLVNVDDERLSTGELLMQWRDATRAAELAERLAEIAVASRGPGRSGRAGVGSDRPDGREGCRRRGARCAERTKGGRAGRRARRREPRATPARRGRGARDRSSVRDGGARSLPRCGTGDQPPSRTASLARTISCMTAEGIRAAIEAATGHYAAHPEQARSTDSEARASLVNGLVIEVEGPAGEHLTTDMVRSVGGTGTAPSPGWLLRAAEASCVSHLDRDACRRPWYHPRNRRSHGRFGVRRSRDARDGRRGAVRSAVEPRPGPPHRPMASTTPRSRSSRSGASIIAPCATRSSARSRSPSRLRRASRHEVAQRCPPPIRSKTCRSS